MQGMQDTRCRMQDAGCRIQVGWVGGVREKRSLFFAVLTFYFEEDDVYVIS